MTREEAIMVLKNEQPHCGKKALFPEEKKYEAYDVAIKALEQEPFMNKPCVAHQVCHEDKVKVLDKIRAEIDEQYDRVHPYDISCAEGLEMALGIIDKYKAEIEDSRNSDYDTAFKMAIKALEQEPCEDCVRRQAAIDALTKTSGIRGDALKALYDLPSVTPQPKTGHWIYDRTRDWDGECKYECSECGMGSDVDYAYCMRCGAKMQESEDKK